MRNIMLITAFNHADVSEGVLRFENGEHIPLQNGMPVGWTLRQVPNELQASMVRELALSMFTFNGVSAFSSVRAMNEPGVEAASNFGADYLELHFNKRELRHLRKFTEAGQQPERQVTCVHVSEELTGDDVGTHDLFWRERRDLAAFMLDRDADSLYFSMQAYFERD